MDYDEDQVPEILQPHVLQVITWPDKRLQLETEEITTFGRSVEQIVLDLTATMKKFGGVAIAAPQVGIMARIIVFDVPDIPLVMINPRVDIMSSSTYEFEEGCLSVPGHFEKRSRPMDILMEWQDSTGTAVNGRFHGFRSFVILHEMDHLIGKVFVDGASRFKTHRVKQKIKKFKRKYPTLKFAD